MELNGYYSEVTLNNLLYEGKIGSLEFVTHLDKETELAFNIFCKNRGLDRDEKAAESFLKEQRAREKEDHQKY